ncbi:radical SAM/SPASM domain-containing protein [Streptomyces inhibens]|uniref:Radical SAM/SPASM domain-containing protein n=1 Tax=Streptomyces inhibens TaxID=2293571 RepID=A0A371PPZ2_STRIH|nr:radical SAM/SPASM domain-containing protein [Streptomyces inhibens]REK84576.1 radical SAM/SPASM domain-containing protein [Streptomyces inhibens]
MTIVAEEPASTTQDKLRVVALEITGACQLQCTQCFAQSGPDGTHGAMTAVDWRRVMGDAAKLGAREVQFIGGEPTVHPAWVELVEYALSLGLVVEVYSNLFHIKAAWWDVLSRPGVRLATSYYSDSAEEHETITTRQGSYARTRANIAEAVQRGIPVRAGIVRVLPGQRVQEARVELEALGVTSIRTDRTRHIGRAVPAAAAPKPEELCGRCGQGQAAVLPSGDVAPCVMSRWMTTGNARTQPLAKILDGDRWERALHEVPARAGADPCDPQCNPASDGSDCAPAEQTACDPAYE